MGADDCLVYGMRTAKVIGVHDEAAKGGWIPLDGDCARVSPAINESGGHCSGPCFSDAVVWRHGSEHETIPGAHDKQQFLAFVQARWFGAKNIESPPLQFAQQSPIDSAHQFRGNHRAAALR